MRNTITPNYCAPLVMERKRTSSQRSTIVTDTKVEQQNTSSKTLKLSLLSSASKLKPNTFLFDAHPDDNQEAVLYTLIKVTENDVSVYCSELVKSLNHINILWKSFINYEPVCMLLVRILRQIVLNCTMIEDSVKEILLHFMNSSKYCVICIYYT